MLCSTILVLLLGNAAALDRKPVTQAIDANALPTTLAELKEQEYELVDRLFVIARDTILAEVQRSRVRTATEAKATAESSAEKAKASVETMTSAAAPAGAPGAPGAKKPPFGPPKKAYLGINPAMKAKTGPIFQLKCAEVLEEMVIKRRNALAKFGHSNETIGIDMATHFQVQCPGSIPMPEDKCDDWSVKLAKFIDAGKPIFIPPPAAPGGPGGGAINSGNDWCIQFF